MQEHTHICGVHADLLDLKPCLQHTKLTACHLSHLSCMQGAHSHRCNETQSLSPISHLACVRACREHALTAAMKLTARLPSEVPRLKAMLAKHARSSALEVQSRSTEYCTLFKLDAAVRSQVRFSFN